MQGKRGQASGAGAATLVLVITILIILYIVFLPPQEQANLIGTSPGIPGTAPVPGSPQSGTVIFTAHPGRIDAIAQREFDHQLPTVNLYTTTTATKLQSIKALSVKHGWFDEAQANFTFTAPNLLQTGKVLLTFNRQDGQGPLMISLNGVQIFQDSLSTYNVEPIELPKDLLHDTNQLLFSVGGVGMKFWTTNLYQLQDLRVTADVTDSSTTNAKEVFLITQPERDNAERATLRFYPDCVPGKVGGLTVTMNGHELFSGVPDCGVLREMEISPAYFLSGENTFEFSAQKGVYLIDQINLHTNLKAATYPTYYFDIDAASASAMISGARPMLYLDFVDDVTQKNAQVFVNGRVFSVSTHDKQWWTMIGSLQPHSNAIEIIPSSTLDVVNLEVVLE